MASIVQLGRLELVPLREAWPDEAVNFTPWLAEEANLAHLSEVLDLDLEFEAKERSVGPFSADILAKNSENQTWVLIENQIAPTDHRHLGQLLTYAAGLDARTIIWIAETFRDEHRAAIDFLNRATTEEYAFFAVQIELYRIGDSAFAPRFSMVAKPNNWSKQTQVAKRIAEGEIDEVQKLNLEYWSSLIKSAIGRYPALSGRTPYKGNWQFLERLRGGDPSLVVNAIFSWDKGLRLEIYIDGNLAKLAFRELLARKAEIEATFGNELVWEEIPQAKASRISFYMPGGERRDSRDRWNLQQDWVLTWAPKLAEAVRPFIPTLSEATLQRQIEG